jgi:superfamily II DNA/RNA helicase
MDAIMKMRNNKLDLLISTDVASRGLNIEVDVVFNYDLPSATNFNEYVS